MPRFDDWHPVDQRQPFPSFLAQARARKWRRLSADTMARIEGYSPAQLAERFGLSQGQAWRAYFGWASRPTEKRIRQALGLGPIRAQRRNFWAAVKLSAEDYQLWKRLGATGTEVFRAGLDTLAAMAQYQGGGE